MESCLDLYSESQISFSENVFNGNEENAQEIQCILNVELQGSNEAVNFRYKLVSSRDFTIRDSEQKCLALQQSLSRPRLVAVHLQGLNSQREEKVSMGFYVTQNLAGSNKRPVTLGLVGRNLYLSCSRVGGDPQLSLETVNNIKEVKNDELEQFIFLKSENGPVVRFESATRPGWYISTSQEENESIRMSPEDDQKYFKDFLQFS